MDWKDGEKNMQRTLDMYGAPVPAFNVQGIDTVRTHCGGCLSLIIMLTASCENDFTFYYFLYFNIVSKYKGKLAMLTNI